MATMMPTMLHVFDTCFAYGDDDADDDGDEGDECEDESDKGDAVEGDDGDNDDVTAMWYCRYNVLALDQGGGCVCMNTCMHACNVM